MWAFSTTAEDANLRNQLYKKIGPNNARKVLARIFPGGTATKYLQSQMNLANDDAGSVIDDEEKKGLINELADRIERLFRKNPNFTEL